MLYKIGTLIGRQECSARAVETVDTVRAEPRLFKLRYSRSFDHHFMTRRANALITQAGEDDHSERKEELVLVNEDDEVIGVEEKIKTHLLGSLHRAFSIFVVNSQGELLLQKRASTKYHSRGLWSNTCCGHPRLGESIKDASRRRLREEMGFDCDLKEVFEFIYRATLEDGFCEHEYNHVLIGRFEENPTPNYDEVDEWKWIELTTLKLDLQKNPETYTCWFRIAFDRILDCLGPTHL